MTLQQSEIGLPPGSLIYKGPKRDHTPKIEVIRYNKEFYDCFNTDIENYKHAPNSIDWIDINGIHDAELVRKVGLAFNIHALLLEDVMDNGQRPSVDEYGEYTVVQLKMLRLNKNKSNIEAEQISLVLGKEFVISFQEKPGDVFNPLRKRIKSGKGRVRAKNSDYLLFAIIDIIVDNYFLLIEEIGNELAKLENEIFNDPNEVILQKIQKNKKQLLTLRKNIYPIREIISNIQRQNYNLIQKDTLKYYKDVNDNILHIIDIIESYRDINSGLKDSYISSISLKMNKIMQMLTIISTIFIPITFIAGVYGMNFEVLPEIQWKYGYLAFWVLVIVTISTLILIFKRKKWL